MKRVFAVLTILTMTLAFYSCKKESNGPGANITPSYSNKIVLGSPQITSDSVVLKWSKLTNSKFYLYLVLRRDYKSTNPETFSFSDIIDEIYNPEQVRFADLSAPFVPYLEYQIVGVLNDTTGGSNYTYVFSNIVRYERTGVKSFYFYPYDVVPDLPNHRLYVIEADSGKISILDYVNKSILRSVKTNSTNGFSALGTYNGTKELYVPRNDGWVFVYNAETLDKIDQISCGTSCGAVISNNGKLFVIGNSSSYYSVIYVVDRATKAVINTVNNVESLRPKMIPGSNTKMYGVSSYYSSSGDLSYYDFDADGNLVSQNSNYVNNSTDYRYFDIFPDGQHFITSYHGTIFNNNLTYLNQLPFGDYEYSSFAFDQSATQILAGCMNYKYIVAYANPGFSEQKTYHMQGFPAFIFNDNNTIISLSSTESFSTYSYGRYFIIESVPLTKK